MALDKKYATIVLGAGAAGIMAAITAAKNGDKVLLVEKQSQIALKLKATGGGRCNLTNTLEQQQFIEKFGKNGRFIQDALNSFGQQDLINFFDEIGVPTHSADGFRIFPTSHNSQAIIDALNTKIKQLDVELLCDVDVEDILVQDEQIIGIKLAGKTINAKKVIMATGGLGYANLGATGDGHKFAKNLGHTITTLSPAMMPLFTKEKWVASCIADTIAKTTIKVDIKKYSKLKASGDLIFTKNGIRGPVVLDFAREITPLLAKLDEVPILINFTKGLNEDQITKHLKDEVIKNPHATILEHLLSLIPNSLAIELCKLSNINPQTTYGKIEGSTKNNLIKLLAWTPLTINGHDGFRNAMITRGGISLKEIDPKTMQSKLIKGLYFGGEIIDIDGPCGGYNLQWAFSSGYLAGS